MVASYIVAGHYLYTYANLMDLYSAWLVVVIITTCMYSYTVAMVR